MAMARRETCDQDRFKSHPTGWRRSGETVPSRFSRLLALMSQINIHPREAAMLTPGGLRGDRDNDDDTRDVDRTTDRRHVQGDNIQ